MGFSFRSIFQSGNDSKGQDTPATSGEISPAASEQAFNPASAMQNFQPNSPQQPSPFSTAGALFKTATGEALHANPVQASPFSAPAAGQNNAPLTVADVLPQLPPELVRTNGLSPDQPVAISAQVLDAALRSGHAALPIFEIYRVCPALFQAPVSPQDPRMVPLPASKLPRLIASAQQSAIPNPVVSPFGTPQSAGSVFAPPIPAGNVPMTSLPPRRNGPPPSLADVPRGEAVPSLSLPTGGSPSVFPASPFAAAGSSLNPPQNPLSPPISSPFGFKPASEPSVQTSLFTSMNPAAPTGLGAQGGTPASPFATFGMTSPASPASPPPSSPFSSLFGPKAVPTGQPAPDVPVRPSVGVGFGAMPTSGATGSSTLRFSLAALLRGYSVAELGFDPIMVPSWIMTGFPSSVVKEWAQQPTPLVELGSLVDGVNDVGFRNVLHQAKRDFQVRIPSDEIQAVLANETPTQSLPNPANAGSNPMVAAENESLKTVPLFSAPDAHYQEATNGVQPPSSFSAPNPKASLFSTTDSQTTQPLSGFGYVSPATSPDKFSPVSTDSGFESSPAPMSNPFDTPVEAQKTFSIPAPQSQETSPPIPSWTVQPPEPAAQLPTAAFQPPSADLGDEVDNFGLGVKAKSQPTFPEAPAEGFSSAQLLGSMAAEAFAPVPPAPSIPVTNPFTGKAATHIVDVSDEADSPSAFLPPKMGFTDDAFGAPTVKPTSSFSPPAFEDEPMSAASHAPYTPRQPMTRSASPSSALGIKSHDNNPDQILLRALLATDDELSPKRVVEMVCSLPGIAACVCIHGDQSISHVGAHKPQAREFQRQATDLAHHLRTLAPLIGIEGAETFTLNSGDRLMTFCFPEGAILGVLHDAEPSLGLRDKITLIARELSRMLD